MRLVHRRARLGFGVHSFGPQRVFTQLGSGTASLRTKVLPLDAKFASGSEGEQQAAASRPLFSASPRQTFMPPKPSDLTRWPGQRPENRTSIREGNSRRPLFPGLSGPLSLFLPSWRPARDGGKPGHRPGPERSCARPPTRGDREEGAGAP